MTEPLLFALFATCIVCEGFFSGSEIALVSADRLRLKADADDGHRGAALALALLDRPGFTLGACLVGTNVCTIGAGTLAAYWVHQRFGWPEVFAAALVIPFTLTLGEMVPKAVYQHHADRLSRIVVYPLRVFATLISPLLWAVERLTLLLGATPESAISLSRQEIRILLEDAPTADLTGEEQQLIRRVFAFTEAVVEDAMVPLIQVAAVPESATIDDVVSRMIETGHSRIPVYRDRIDRVTGVVLHSDLIGAEDWSAPISSVARPPLFVPETARVDTLLLQLRRQRQRLAIAVDEYGGAAGLITVEDLLEEIVGEIEDESDKGRAAVRRTGKRDWVAAGHAEREHLEAACGLLLPDGDFETVAGYLLMVLGRVPRTGEFSEVGEYTLLVSKASDRAILEIKISRKR